MLRFLCENHTLGTDPRTPRPPPCPLLPPLRARRTPRPGPAPSWRRARRPPPPPLRVCRARRRCRAACVAWPRSVNDTSQRFLIRRSQVSCMVMGGWALKPPSTNVTPFFLPLPQTTRCSGHTMRPPPPPFRRGRAPHPKGEQEIREGGGTVGTGAGSGCRSPIRSARDR